MGKDKSTARAWLKAASTPLANGRCSPSLRHIAQWKVLKTVLHQTHLGSLVTFLRDSKQATITALLLMMTQVFPEVFRRDIQGRTKIVQPQQLTHFVTGEGVAYRELRHYLDNPKYLLPALEQVIKASDFTGLKTFVEGVQIPPASHWDTDATDESVS